MELIKGNLLILLVEVSVFVFVIAYVKLSDSPFRQTFIFSRRQIFQYELRIAGRVIAGITAVGVVLYYLLCMVLKADSVPVWNMILFLLVQMDYYFSLSSARLRKNVVGVLFLILTITALPVVDILIIVTGKVKQDVYCGYFILFFLAAAFVLGKGIFFNRCRNCHLPDSDNTAWSRESG